MGLVEGYGRVVKYRHYLYEWLGVDKVELAVMTELLLRGDQTVGELRSRVARMEPVADLNALRGPLDSLKVKGLVVSLTPEGRGHVVTHALYKPRELEALCAKYSAVRLAEPSDVDVPSTSAASGRPPGAAAPSPAESRAAGLSGSAISGGGVSTPPDAAAIASMRRDLEELRAQVAQLRHALEESLAEQQRLGDELRSLKDGAGRVGRRSALGRVKENVVP